MAKFMNFSAHVQNVFENDESKFMGFQSLLHDATVGKGEVEGYSKKEVNDKIVSLFRAAIGCDETSSAKEIRKAIRRNQNVIFISTSSPVSGMVKLCSAFRLTTLICSISIFTISPDRFSAALINTYLSSNKFIPLLLVEFPFES